MVERIMDGERVNQGRLATLNRWSKRQADRSGLPSWIANRICVHPGAIPRNTDIIAAGEPNSIVFVHHGWLFRHKLMPDGRRTVLNFVLSGDLTGAECRFQKSAPAFLTTATDCVVSVIGQRDIWRLHSEVPELDGLLAECATKESALLARQLVRVARMSAYERIADLLLELMTRLRAVGLASENSFNLPLTQPLLADALGLTHIHVNRVLQVMKRDGIIHQHCHRITLPNLQRLERIAGIEDDPLTSGHMPCEKFPGSRDSGASSDDAADATEAMAMTECHELVY